MSADTILNWENGGATPSVRMLPRIIGFLGYDPYPEPRTLGEQIAAKRRQLGVSRKRAAKTLGVDEATLARWEKGTSHPARVRFQIVDEFLLSHA